MLVVVVVLLLLLGFLSEMLLALVLEFALGSLGA